VQDKPLPGQEGKTFFHIPDKGLLAIGFIAFCCMLGEGAMSDWTANYLKQIVEVNNALAAVGLFAFSTAMMVGRLGGDSARAKFGDQKLIFYESIIAIFGLTIALSFPYSIPVMIGFFLVGIGLATIVPIAYSQAGTMPGLNPGVGIGMVTTIGYSGFLIGPPIIGFLADLFNLRIALFFILGLFFIMFFLTRKI
jgi:MFS family permease